MAQLLKKITTDVGKRVFGIVIFSGGVINFVDERIWGPLLFSLLIGLPFIFFPRQLGKFMGQLGEFMDSKLFGINEKNYPEYFAELRKK